MYVHTHYTGMSSNIQRCVTTLSIVSLLAPLVLKLSFVRDTRDSLVPTPEYPGTYVLMVLSHVAMY